MMQRLILLADAEEMYALKIELNVNIFKVTLYSTMLLVRKASKCFEDEVVI